MLAPLGVAMSPIWPTGLAGNAEPHPGLAFDWSVFAAGVCAVTVFAVLVGAISTARLVSHLRSGRSVEPGRNATSRLLHESGLPVPLAVGAQHALEPGRGRTAVPVRSAILATALGGRNDRRRGDVRFQHRQPAGQPPSLWLVE